MALNEWTEAVLPSSTSASSHADEMLPPKLTLFARTRNPFNAVPPQTDEARERRTKRKVMTFERAIYV